MGTFSGRAWLSALALVVGAAPAFAQSEPVQLDPMTVRRLTDLPGEAAFLGSPYILASRNSVEFNGRLYFLSNVYDPKSSIRVGELWVTDGTPQGTRSLQEWLPPSTSIDPLSLRATPHRLFFTARTPGARFQLWTSDGTREGTHLTRELPPDRIHGVGYQTPIIPVGDSVLFTVLGTGGLPAELWKSDGTEAGTVPIKNVAADSAYVTAGGSARLGDTVFFTASGPAGEELWRTDGTEAGTLMVRDLNPGPGSAFPRDLTAVGGLVYFAAQTRQEGHSLWKSDGTAEGTVRVADFPREGAGNHIFHLTALGDTVFFISYAPEGISLWRSDGTEAGTLPVMTKPASLIGGTSQGLFPVGNRLYLVGQDSVAGDSLWVTDGTPEGTTRLPRPAPFERAFIDGATAWEGGLAFTVTTGEGASELWRTDGTDAGTSRLTRLPSGQPSATSAGLVPFQGALLTTAGDAWTPRALWRLERDDASLTFVCPATKDVPSNRPEGTDLFNHPPELRSGPEGAAIRSTFMNGRLLRLHEPTPITYQAEDALGRFAYCTTVTTSRDLTAPAMNNCPTALTLSAQSARGVTFYYPGLLIVDETSRDVLVTYSPENGSVLPLGTTQMTVTAKDASGNVNTCSFPVTVRDNQGPGRACKVNEVRVEAEGPGGAHAFWPDLTPSDSISSQVTVTSTHASGDLFPLGLTRVQVVSTDDAGNSTTCEIQVRVRDSRPPALTCPEDQTLTTSVMSGTRAEYPAATAADSVSEAELLYSPVVGTPLAPGLHAVQVTAIDAAGNAALCDFHLTVQYDPTSDMRQSMGCSVGSGPESAVGWVALVALAWTLSRRLKDGKPRG
ncbi:HYR domain-containing protein [Corallococcus sp. AB045]|uniref:HYR domain-containing protein n=1 Tax=Corallococcus sp. AB045 TaxID=2316719 RepID=UPI000EF0CCC9|nr:HYR domain-containing protein [Corallococcus sp. AB045]RKH88309.1 HYR domain-containing protein [Corallococcus sp. AB045]